MATLVFKKWWMQENKLFLVSESIGNHTSSIDTLSYEIIQLTPTLLELKNSDYILKYRKK